MTESHTPYKKAFAKIDSAKRLRVLDTATRVFAERGFVGANINIIAKEAGVSIGAMYNYFDTKENLFLTVVDHLHDFLEQGLLSTVREGDQDGQVGKHRDPRGKRRTTQPTVPAAPVARRSALCGRLASG